MTIFLLGGVLLFAGCGEEVGEPDKGEKSSQEEKTKEELDEREDKEAEKNGSENDAEKNETENNQIEDAVLREVKDDFKNSMSISEIITEKNEKGAIDDKEDIYDLLRKRFTENLTEKYIEHIWSDHLNDVSPSGWVIHPPGSEINVEHVEDEEAIVFYKISDAEMQKQGWNIDEYGMVKMEYQESEEYGDRWVTAQIDNVDSMDLDKVQETIKAKEKIEENMDHILSILEEDWNDKGGTELSYPEDIDVEPEQFDEILEVSLSPDEKLISFIREPLMTKVTSF